MPALDSLLFVLAFATALGCALMAGTFFAFSSFVMRALGRLPPPQGLRAMQSINVAVLNRVFLGVFVGTAFASAALVVGAVLRWPDPAAPWWLAGALLYLVGNLVVTASANVPLNERLARVDAQSPDADAAWRAYRSRWTRWNHVRTVTALGATAALIVALCRQGAAAAAP